MAGTGDEWQEGKKTYRAFLLRCWQENNSASRGKPDDLIDWRFTLVHPEDRAHPKCFASLEELVAYLQKQLGLLAGDATTPKGDSAHQCRASPDADPEWG